MSEISSRFQQGAVPAVQRGWLSKWISWAWRTVCLALIFFKAGSSVLPKERLSFYTELQVYPRGASCLRNYSIFFLIWFLLYLKLKCISEKHGSWNNTGIIFVRKIIGCRRWRLGDFAVRRHLLVEPSFLAVVWKPVRTTQAESVQAAPCPGSHWDT